MKETSTSTPNVDNNASQARTAAPRLAFLGLPRELRDLIYGHYLYTAKGYRYDLDREILTQYDGTPIELEIMYVCRQMAAETRGLALGGNTITFTTVSREDIRRGAEIWHECLYQVEYRQAVLLGGLTPRLLTSEMKKVAAKRFPEFSSLLEQLSQPEKARAFVQFYTIGEAPSLRVEFVRFILEQLCTHPRFLEEATMVPRLWGDAGCDAQALKDASFDPWIIPGLQELKDVALTSQGYPDPFSRPITHVQFSYSAASAAIKFLQSTSAIARSHMRKLVLLENGESMARPECHGAGLVSYCQANPKLCVERFVSLWESAFTVKPERRAIYTHDMHEDVNDPIPEFLKSDRLFANTITRSVATWIVECLRLPSLGMPEGSFTLVLDGNPIPDKTAEVFQVVQRDVAWQKALDLCYARDLLPYTWLDRRFRCGFIYDALPNALRDISQESSLIRCNFDPGLPQDPEALVAAHNGWSIEEWERAWDTHEPAEYQTVPPLPPWHVLRWRRVLP
jgi:hypothetical protein